MTETLSHIALRRLNGATACEWYTPLPHISVHLNAEGCLCIDAPQLCSTTLETHDLAEMNAQGQFRILGRTDNVVCSGGLKLQIETLEKQLAPLDTPFCLTAVPDAMLGEALVLLHLPTSKDVRAVCQQLLARLEQPRHFLEVETLPLTDTGKPARAQARQLALQLLQR